ncbi:hypothetical protein BDN72DRAFT_947427 [Pluteus cervinus]|uniref:Uncharacterized protein n=1 Tax=Pluteus cervinus TaxID=181527 RepID=A0ACD3ATS5_9AGAR|nr:hypothetical protein BDN72DRAFT_947427 [Pluteus cervinus]
MAGHDAARPTCGIPVMTRTSEVGKYCECIGSGGCITFVCLRDKLLDGWALGLTKGRVQHSCELCEIVTKNAERSPLSAVALWHWDGTPPNGFPLFLYPTFTFIILLSSISLSLSMRTLRPMSMELSTSAAPSPASTTSTVVNTPTIKPHELASCFDCNDTNFCDSCRAQNFKYWAIVLSPSTLPLSSNEHTQLRAILGFVLATSELPVPPCGGYPSIAIIGEILGIPGNTITYILQSCRLIPWPVKLDENTTLDPPYMSPSLRMFLTEAPSSADSRAVFPIDVNEVHRVASTMCWAMFHGYNFDKDKKPFEKTISLATKLYCGFAWAQHYMKGTQKMALSVVAQFTMSEWFEWVSNVCGETTYPMEFFTEFFTVFLGPEASPQRKEKLDFLNRELTTCLEKSKDCTHSNPNIANSTRSTRLVSALLASVILSSQAA